MGLATGCLARTKSRACCSVMSCTQHCLMQRPGADTCCPAWQSQTLHTCRCHPMATKVLSMDKAVPACMHADQADCTARAAACSRLALPSGFRARIQGPGPPHTWHAHLRQQQVGQDEGHRARAPLVAVHQRCAAAGLRVLHEVNRGLEVLLDGLILDVLQGYARPPGAALGMEPCRLRHSTDCRSWAAGGATPQPAASCCPAGASRGRAQGLLPVRLHGV